jgi:hypothetical protein
MDPAQRGEAPAESRIGIRSKQLANVRILTMPSWELQWKHVDGCFPAMDSIPVRGRIHEYLAPIIFFIDGDHSFTGVRSDTLLCLDMLRSSPFGGMLIWHDDYEGAPDWCGVRRYLDQQRLCRVIRIPDTWVSFAVVRPRLYAP